MALLAKRSIADALLSIDGGDFAFPENHILEPEFHQERYVRACTDVKKISGSFQLGAAPGLIFGPARGVQPIYADDDADADSLDYEGMVDSNGSVLDSSGGKRNVCALKSNCVRRGYIDFSLARSVSRTFHSTKNKAQVFPNDILINSTGDGTIGRVAVFSGDFPAMVDGHISIVRFKDAVDAWYVAAFLLSDLGQRQIYRYINGSSGQVEIYPQDLGRIWIKPPQSPAHKKAVAAGLKSAADLHSDFYRRLQTALAAV